jgi:hypothetical protein
MKDKLFYKLLAGFIIFLLTGCAHLSENVPEYTIVVDANKRFQTIEGFGVNINPDQWRDGNFKKVIDLLVDDLGCTFFRFDCYGFADWLDPAKRDKTGKYSDEYLKEIYTSKRFQDAWETFRYLNSKGAEPFFNVSGKINSSLGETEKPNSLADFDGYAEMGITMLKWARTNENLKFSLFAPFNETDLSYPEGPGISAEESVPSVRAIIKKLNEYGLSDIKLIIMDDNGVRFHKLRQILKDTLILPSISKFAVHTYGIGSEQYARWWQSESEYGMLADSIKTSLYANCALWLTEFGDLDQSGLGEFDFSWTITRRLMKCLKEGYSAAMFWDAMDNYHRHDNAWSTYGLLKTDTLTWSYITRQRLYALKQVYKYVKPGFKMIDVHDAIQARKYDVYRQYHDTINHINMLAFVSQDNNDLTIVGMNKIEGDFNLEIKLEGLSPETYNKRVIYLRTSRNENCIKVGNLVIKDKSLKIRLKENSIFTLTTLK